MWVKATQEFNDIKENMKLRRIGDVFEVDEKRGNILIFTGYVIRSKKPTKKEDKE